MTLNVTRSRRWCLRADTSSRRRRRDRRRVYAPREGTEAVSRRRRSAQDDGYGKVIAKLRPGAEFRSGTFPTHRFSFCLASAHERIDERDKASGDRVALPEGIIVKSHVVTSERDVTVTANAPSSLLDGHVSCRRSPCRTSADKARCPRQCPNRGRWGRASSKPSEDDLFSRGREL